MPHADPAATQDDRVRRILARTRTIAVVGASPDASRPSHRVMAFLQSRGFRTIPVNPRAAGGPILGERCVARLEDIDEPIDLVDVFRMPSAVPEIVESAIRVGAKAVWMQLGIRHDAAAARAQAAGLEVVMDRCPAIDMPRLGIPGPGG
ncbi:MAG: CoA-binding protein [Gammaproteobacteria bacterium]|nr:CoA-binding protein [Gammaproteobacteria bacterium]